MRLIIVEDDLLTAEVIRDSINWSMFGIHEVSMAHNVIGAQKLFEEKVPDIVICDIEMPKGTGIDLIKWARSNDYKSEFIFLTCHENFEFASTALDYNAISYITKPFNIDKTEMAILKAVEKIKKESYLHRYSEYGQHWVDNKRLMIENFCRELLFFSIPAEEEIVLEEILRRKIPLSIDASYYLVLISVVKSENQTIVLDDKTFEYALKKILSEVLIDEFDLGYAVHYVTERNHNVAIVIQDKYSVEEIKEKCISLIEKYEKYLKCSATCYIGSKSTITLLGKNRVELEEIDQNNIIFRSKVFFQGEKNSLTLNAQYSIDTVLLNSMLEKRDKLNIVNYIKKELELLVAKNNLDVSVMRSIHQDFMQIIYTFLYKREIQAHKLFSDKISQKLNFSADNSIFDMMKWVHFIITRTIDYAEEAEKSQSIIEKSKKYIHDNFNENITKNDVAAKVFLTPDYVAKLFKAEVGIAIKEYINQCRIERAKELLISTNTSISIIASEVGFDNFSYFSTIFKKLTGLSPYSYRKKDEK
ncbi:hypothetical protein CFB3_16770 [Clostridium folliculivorans]|uniref:Stage 0 sporulation protein A homolog n=1 Tax=Clostridium folliculivorans TaxID=2886038 RepID=A0A9W5XYM1_9CLOT|nr:helix-turn-helix domain-containing protein [Clostridium folliculivorans]GKU23454.1 hypothetical protein CFOLD11_02800 [Clostridium folliculivorans]GKU29570.1 hypothetical protein CFB3_16770 [Clostridium folliculivorans]